MRWALLLVLLLCGGCREHVNRLPENVDLLGRIALIEVPAPDPVASLGSMVSNQNPFDDPFNQQDTSVSMSESVMLDSLLRASPKDKVQRWFVDAFSLALLDNFRDVKLVSEDACDARLVVEILTYGVFAASAQSSPEVQFSAEARMISCVDQNGLWQFSTTKIEALPRAASRQGFNQPGQGAAGPVLSDENLAFIVERLAAGTGVKIAQQMRRDADGK